MLYYKNSNSRFLMANDKQQPKTQEKKSPKKLRGKKEWKKEK